MANAIGRGVRQQVLLQRSALNWSGEDRIPGGVLSNVNRRFVSSQADGLDAGRKEFQGEIASPSLDKAAALPWSWSFQEARNFHTRNISQLVTPKGNNKRLFLVDTLALVRCRFFFESCVSGTSALAELGFGEDIFTLS